MRAFQLGAFWNRGLFVCYLLLLVWAPFPLGSNRPWSWAILELWVFVLTIGWLLAFAFGGARLGATFKAAWPALACCAIWLAYVWLQLLPLPLDMLRALSPEAANLHGAALAIPPGGANAAPLTVDRYAGEDAALKSSAYVLYFALSLALLDRRARIAAAAYTLVASGVIQALYGGFTALAAPGGDVAHGTFPNRDHYAGYLVMCLSMGLGMLIGGLKGDAKRTGRQLARDVVAWILGPGMRLRVSLAVMVIALVLTHSRMGNASFFISMLVAGGIGLMWSKRAPRTTVLLIATLVVIDIAIVGTYFGVERVVHRLEQTSLTRGGKAQSGTTEESVEERSVPAVLAFAMFRDYPWFGSGLGSFRLVFPRFRGPEIETFYTHAHNDYIEFAVETGIVGIVLLGLLVLMSFIAAMRAHYVRNDPMLRGISFGAIMAILALMMHSTVDFNLQIPANALTFMLVLAFAWVSLHHDRSTHSGAERHDR